MKILRLLFKNKTDKIYLNEAKELLSEASFRHLYRLFVQDKLYFAYNKIAVPSEVISNSFFPQCYISKEKHQKHLDDIQRINDEIKDNFLMRSFRIFSKSASEFISKKYAHRISGYEPLKKAVVLMLLSDKTLNFLVVGNKEDKAKDIFVESVRDIYPDCVLGKGSELLGLRYENDQYQEGLMPKANGKVLCLKELEDIHAVDAEFLKLAVDKKVIFINHEDKTFSEITDFKLLAVASTKELRFVSNSPDILNQQVPFDKDIQNCFDLRFICRNITRDLSGLKDVENEVKLKQEDFVFKKNSNESIIDQITRLKDQNLVDEQEYIRKYMSFVQDIDVHFNEKLNDHIVQFSEKLDSLYDPRKFIAQPDKANVVRIVLRLAKANARLSMRSEVMIEDLVEAQKIVTYSFLIN